MYYVLKDLMNINSIVVMEFNKTIIDQEIPMKDIQTNFLDKTFVYPLKEYDEEIDYYYNNIELTGGKLKTKLQILQDYGDDEGCIGDSLKEIPKFLVLPEFNPSIGWYDGYICYVTPIESRLFVIKLIEHEEINLTTIRDKRPYNFKAYFDDNDPDKKIKLEIRLSSREYNTETRKFEGNTEVITVDTSFTWNMLTEPSYLNKAYYYLYPHTEWSNDEMSKYITPNELVNLGFSLINKGYNENGESYWIKGKFKLYTNVLPLPNDCYWVGNKDLNNDKANIIFRLDELESEMKKCES